MRGETTNPSSKSLFWEMLKLEMIQRSFNRTAVWNLPKRNWLLRRWLGSIDGNPYLVQIPFHVSFGGNIHVGKNFFSNCNCVLMDYAPITIGDNVLLAPNVTITTVNHSLDPDQRRVFDTKDSFHPGKKGNWEIIAPVTIGDDVWIGTGAIILPGITIGSGSIIGAGSVVTHDIPPNVLAFGVPCRVAREITNQNGELI
ncbi:MAG: sugar O-acetyltransferase [Ruminococcaceae bacterium]|nr:sugar O-acetyltransferase [Oscillospiraceae bacterium]